MKSSFKKLFMASSTVLVLASFALTPLAEAARGGGGGHGGGGGAQGGGGGRQNVQAKNHHADSRTTNVRSTSVNNVNVNKNVHVDVDVDRHGGCCNNGWDNDYHPVATAAAIGATVAVTSAIVGSMVRTVPPGCVPVNYGGMIYQQCGGAWYAPQGTQFIVVNPPY